MTVRLPRVRSLSHRGRGRRRRRAAYAVLHVAMARAIRSRKVTIKSSYATSSTSPRSRIGRSTRGRLSRWTASSTRSPFRSRTGRCTPSPSAPGSRQGQILGLRWEDVDLDARTPRDSAKPRSMLRPGAGASPRSASALPRLWRTIEDLHAGRTSPTEARKVTGEVVQELRVVEFAIRAVKVTKRLGGT